jgi:phosphatidylinositol glycan class B
MKRKSLFTPTEWKWLLTSLFFHLCAAYFSVGYFSYDEHYQILEFAAHKFGLTPAKELVFEYQVQIRSWFQPALDYVLMRFSSSIGWHEAWQWEWVIKTFHACLGWISLVCMALCAKRWIKSPRLATQAVAFLSLVYFFPYFHARTSGENLSSSLVWMATLLLMNKRGFWAFLLCALAFEARYQSALMSAGLAAWALLQPRFRNRNFIAASTLGGLLGLSIGALMDRWGYGHWTFPAFQYVLKNQIEGYSRNFGVSPWWDYFPSLGALGIPGVHAVLLALLIVFCIRCPKHLISLLSLPFLWVHFSIAHKEPRFLFPLAGAAALAVFLLWEKETSARHWIEKHVSGIYRKIFFRLAFAANAVFLLILCFGPCKLSIVFIRGLKQHLPAGQMLYSKEQDPLTDIQTLHFYDWPGYRFERVTEIPPDARWVYVSKPGEIAKDSRLRGCSIEYQALPRWLSRLNFHHWADRAANGTLLRCDLHDS